MNQIALSTIKLEGSSQTGVGGAVTYYDVPVMLFNDHWVRLSPSVEAIDNPIADRQSFPNQWKEWRVSADNSQETQVLKGTRWDRIGGTESYPPQPPGHKIDRTYFTISGGGNSSFGGEITIVNASWLRFVADGTFRVSSSYQKIAGTQVFVDDTVQTGTYLIDGYILTMTFPNGKTVRRILTSFENNIGLFLDEAYYCEAKHNGDRGCE